MSHPGQPEALLAYRQAVEADPENVPAIKKLAAAYQAEGRELQRADLYECEECSRKSGSPRLCSRCLEARDKAGNAWRGARVYT